MVRALHAAGLEVILDVVYNHTAEGDAGGPTLCFRGLDNAAYYRLRRATGAATWTTPAAATRWTRTARRLRLVMDALRYWVEEMHVDGFRFDLAAGARARRRAASTRTRVPQAVGQDPVLSRVKLIAEPWDIGAGGYEVGDFPPGWSEWNGKYRDTVRDFWRGAEGTLPDLATPSHRLAADLYGDDGRAPVGVGQLRHRPRRLHARRSGERTTASTTTPTARTTATARATTAAGTAAPRGRPRTPASWPCARASDGTCSPPCSSPRAFP